MHSLNQNWVKKKYVWFNSITEKRSKIDDHAYIIFIKLPKIKKNLHHTIMQRFIEVWEFSNIYFCLRFDLLNAINTYLGLKIQCVLIEFSIPKLSLIWTYILESFKLAYKTWVSVHNNPVVNSQILFCSWNTGMKYSIQRLL